MAAAAASVEATALFGSVHTHTSWTLQVYPVFYSYGQSWALGFWEQDSLYKSIQKDRELNQQLVIVLL